MTSQHTIRLIGLILLAWFSCCERGNQLIGETHPNIILIFADDMGIDSVSAFNDRLGLKTPHIDRLANEGFSFMDAHSTSAVCSPSRYGLLTGRYNWRSRLKRGIVGQWERPLIEPNRLTMPEMLRRQGYRTHMIGKWHLGFNWPSKTQNNSEPPTYTSKLAEIDFSGAIQDGPNGKGFDYWFGDDVPNWPPYAWRENDKLLGTIATSAEAIGLTKYTGVNPGPAVAGWRLESVLPEYGKRCAEFIHAQKDSERPFFLYFPMPSPHSPIAPDQPWKGTSGISEYADFLIETDAIVGQLLKALDDTQQANNTIVIFTTDNGTSPIANFESLAKKGVHLTENFRGNKADAFEGGHRVPLIVRWPGVTKPSSRSNEVVSLVDLMATLADITNYDLPDEAAEDSLSLLPLLQGKRLEQPLHEAIVCHSISGHFAIRQGGENGQWKTLFCRGSGGWSAPREAVANKQGLPAIQLYDMKNDPKESVNLHLQHPEIVEKMTETLRRFIENGRSTPGIPQANDQNSVHWTNVPWKK